MADTSMGGRSENERFNYPAFVANNPGATLIACVEDKIVYAQGEPADAAFYIVSGKVKVTVYSNQGKEGVLAILGPRNFFGLEGLQAPARRESAITATSACELIRINRETMARALATDAAFSRLLLNNLLDQNEKFRADLIDQMFNSSEKRLARILLTLANAEPDAQSRIIAIPITQETLASMVGTTRARINHFMNKFRKLGYVEYGDRIRVHGSLMEVLLNGRTQSDENRSETPGDE